MIAGLAHLDNGEMRLEDARTGEIIENLWVREVKQEAETLDHFTNRGGHRQLDRQIVVDRKIILTVEVLVTPERPFMVSLQGAGGEKKTESTSEWLRVVRFPRRDEDA